MVQLVQVIITGSEPGHYFPTRTGLCMYKVDKIYLLIEEECVKDKSYLSM